MRLCVPVFPSSCCYFAMLLLSIKALQCSVMPSAPSSAGARLFETHVPHADAGMRKGSAIGKLCTLQNISKLLYPL